MATPSENAMPYSFNARSLRPSAEPEGFMRLQSVMRLTGLGRSTIYRMINRQTFPKPVQLSERSIGWRRGDVEQWSRDRPAATR
ncbi:helix-turn-helix transcriptional regulator [Rubrivivax gelatinosus]|uniref:helix-turn-helix transcriptional regulator n=1 Tax=Rubrivivax gelatinosus TaxID=28068 RepID=UPI001F5B6737|nr:AlpA family phage regulatory protein [Rubrivivax gelatinosus]